MFFIIIFILVIALFVGMIAYTKTKEEPGIYEEDEKIYDPDSGMEFTIDEAENIILKTDKNRLIPEDELEKHYSEEYKQIEYLRRLFNKHNIHSLEDVSNYINLLKKTELMAHYDDYDLAFAEIKPGIFLGWVYVIYSGLEGRKMKQYSEYQWMMAIYDEFEKFDISRLPDHSKFLYETIESVLFIKSIHEAVFEDAKHLFEYLRRI